VDEREGCNGGGGKGSLDYGVILFRVRFGQVAVPALLAVRIEIPQDSRNEGEREYLMSTQNLYEEWERRTREHGREQEAKRALSLIFEARFGTMPRALADAVEAERDTSTLERWLVLAGTRSQEEVIAAVQADRPPRAS